ncbi:MAG TPA: SLBB domain-containing protein [Gemmatimonadaceae bacterium]
MRTKHVVKPPLTTFIISPARVAVRALALLIVLWAPAAAQAVARDSAASDSGRAPATRALLEARAAAAEKAATSGPADQRAAKRQEAAAIRERLKDGDFQVGDRIALTVYGGAAPISDTATVRAGRTLELPNLPPIPLQGVLHAEIGDYLTAQLSRYIKHPTVQAIPLIRLGVLGEVKSPGFFSVPTDILVSDAIMRAGGPTGNADINKTTITRGKQEVWGDKALRQAIVSGMTLDQLNLRPGDALVVAKSGNHNLLQVLQVGGILLGVGLSIYTATRR